MKLIRVLNSESQSRQITILVGTFAELTHSLASESRGDFVPNQDCKKKRFEKMNVRSKSGY